MAMVTGKLSDLKCKRAKGRPGLPYLLSDGGCLYLRVSSTGARYWIMRYSLHGKPHVLGIGPYPLVSLAEAREKVLEARKLKLEHIDPIAARRAKRAGVAVDAAKSMTFAACAEAYIEAHKAGWKSAKHQGQWRNTIEMYANPVIGSLPVAAIDTGLVLKVLQQKLDGEPLWVARAESAKRLRGRIESVLDWARVSGFRDGENPARWKGHLDHLLPPPRKTQRVVHHDALAYAELPAFMLALAEVEGIPARCVEFLVLTCARSGEARGVTWGEINLAERLWIVPASKMKAGKEHRVPLSARALEILVEMRFGCDSPDPRALVFPSVKRGRPLPDKTLLKVLRNMGQDSVTVHGFRSSFRDWAAEKTSYPREACELALAHAVGSAVEQAYRRSDLFERRRALMRDWGAYCATLPGAAGDTVVAFPGVAAR